MSYLLVLWAGLVGGSMPLAAQPAIPAFQDQLVVSATLSTEEAGDAPAAVTVIGSEEIAARQATAVADLLSSVAGATVVASGPAGQVASLFLRGSDSDQSLVLWNGFPLNSPYFGGFNWAFLPADGVERIEIVRGPASALYGSPAIGGVVQVLTGRQRGTRLRLETGEHGYRRAGLSAGADLGSLHFDLLGSLRRGGSEFENDEFEGEEGTLRAEWRARDGVTIGMLARSGSFTTGIPWNGGQPSPRRRISWNENELALPVEFSNARTTFDALLSRVITQSAFRDPEDPWGFTAADTETEALRARVVGSQALGAHWELAAGGEVERDEVFDDSVFGPNLQGEHQRTWALFGEARAAVSRWRATLGLRRDDNELFGGQVSPRLGFIVVVTDSLRLRASYGEAFRAPSLGELYFPGSGNSELAPEESRSYEIGFDWERRGLRLALAGFETRQKNLIDFDFATFQNVNVGRARSRGVEAEAAYRTERLRLRASATWLEAEDRTTGEPLLRRPRWSASAVASTTPGRWTHSLVLRYVGERADVDPVSFARTNSPSYTRIDLATSVQAGAHLAPYLRIENAAAREYAEALGFPAPGRSWIVGLALGF